MIAKPEPRDPAMPANPMIEKNCPCTNDCPRHGNCFECVAHHREMASGLLPACLRRKEEDKK